MNECDNVQENVQENVEQTNHQRALEILINKDCFCFEGGGVLGIGEVGALTRLYELGGARKIHCVVGTSVGSIIAGALGCGASIDFVKNSVFGINLQSFKDGSCGLSNAIRFLKKGHFGWYKGDAIENFMGGVLKELTGNENITFLEAYNKYKIRLTIVYFSVNYGKTRYADYTTQPNLQIKRAVRRSSSIPAFYSAVWEKRCNNTPEVFVDGGITDNYPLHVLKEQECCAEKILGFKLCSVQEFNEFKEDMGEEVDEVDDGTPSNIYTYIMKLIGVVHSQALRYHVKEEDWKNTVKINVGGYSTTDFGISKESLMWLYNQGVEAVDKYLQEIEGTLIQSE